MLAQFVFDFVATATRMRLIEGDSPLSELGLIAPVYALDAALAAIGLLAAFAAIELGRRSACS